MRTIAAKASAEVPAPTAVRLAQGHPVQAASPMRSLSLRYSAITIAHCTDGLTLAIQSLGQHIWLTVAPWADFSLVLNPTHIADTEKLVYQAELAHH